MIGETEKEKQASIVIISIMSCMLIAPFPSGGFVFTNMGLSNKRALIKYPENCLIAASSEYEAHFTMRKGNSHMRP